MLMSHDSPKKLPEGLKSRIVGFHQAVKFYRIDLFGGREKDTPSGMEGTLAIILKSFKP